MDFAEIKSIITKNNSHTFQAVNFGCRVNSAEINQLSQLFVDLGLTPATDNPDIIIINTCAVTKKGEIESLSRVRILNQKYPHSTIFVTGCANLKKVSDLSQVVIFDNKAKEQLLNDLNCAYSFQIKDKFSHSRKFLLKVQSGCTANCTYCIVPLKRPQLWSLPPGLAVKTINQAVSDGYREVIITGVNLNQYRYGFSNLVEALLTQTTISHISFGSVPVLCIDDKFIDLLETYPDRISHFLHIPLQSGSDKILTSMNRIYDRQKIVDVFTKLKNTNLNLTFGTDIIVGYPGETDSDFEDTFKLCQQIGFTKIHTFRFSPRTGTRGLQLFKESVKILTSLKKLRSQRIRTLVK